MNQIPKVIHYIWLGGKPLPKIAKKCIKSWKKYCPDYEIKRWDESNVDLDSYKYIRDAYDAKKYAFASDCLRFDILNREGGIYLDIDVELIRPIDEFLNNKMFMCFENDKYVAPGLIIGTTKNNECLEKILDIYKTSKFDCSDLTKMVTVCAIATNTLKEYGLIEENKTQELSCGTIYSSEYFCPKSMSDGKTTITDNTYSIHHYLGSWSTPWIRFKNKCIQLVKRIIGKKNVERIKRKMKK